MEEVILLLMVMIKKMIKWVPLSNQYSAALFSSQEPQTIKWGERRSRIKATNVWCQSTAMNCEIRGWRERFGTFSSALKSVKMESVAGNKWEGKIQRLQVVVEILIRHLRQPAKLLVFPKCWSVSCSVSLQLKVLKKKVSETLTQFSGWWIKKVATNAFAWD